MAKAALKSTTSIPRPAAINPKEAANTVTEEAARSNIIELGNRVRLAEHGLLTATAENKASKADSMRAFTEYAELGLISVETFPMWFLAWRYDAKLGITKVDRKHAGEMSRFMKAVKAGIVARERGTSFLDIIDDVQAQVTVMQDKRKADKTLPDPKQADQAVYSVLTRMAEKAGAKDGSKGMVMLTGTEMQSAIVKPPKAEVTFASTISDMLATVNLLLDPKEAAKAKLAVPVSERAFLQRTRATLEEIENRALAEDAETETA